MALLIESLDADGFTQPIVARPANADGIHVIVDGEHRFVASGFLGYDKVPVCVLDQDDAGCIAATVRHNRARGHHGVQHTANIVQMLKNEGLSREDIADALGLDDEELIRLELSETAFLAFAAGKDALT